MLPKNIGDIPEKIEIRMRRGFSSKASDTTNPIKIFEDVFCKKYGYDDRRHFRIITEKEIVKKGSEYIMFKIEKFEKLLDR